MSSDLRYEILNHSLGKETVENISDLYEMIDFDTWLPIETGMIAVELEAEDFWGIEEVLVLFLGVDDIPCIPLCIRLF